jgi:2-polyprenyl-3-methyl-5-hydroxy-6-metoxy-1,4-benzoquinol methylase
MSLEEISQTNREFYEQAYRPSRNKVSFWRKRLSFDQQSKLDVNWKLLAGWIREGNSVRKVLEVGCGFGLVLSKLPREVAFVGTDISHNAAKILYESCISEGRQALMFVNDSVGHLPLKAEFDVIICSHVLEHVQDDFSLLREFRRLVAPTGVVLLNVPINETVPDPNHVRAYQEETFPRTLGSAGFHIIDQIKADRLSGWFLQWRADGGNELALKIMRATCALLPYRVRECLGAVFLRRHSFQQFALLAVPAPGKD